MAITKVNLENFAQEVLKSEKKVLSWQIKNAVGEVSVLIIRR